MALSQEDLSQVMAAIDARTADEIVAAREAEAATLAAAVDAVLVKLAGKQSLTADEEATLEVAELSGAALAAAVSKKARVLHFQTQAGSEQDRADAVAAAEAAEAALALRKNAIPAEIAALEAELAGLRSAAVAARKASDARAVAAAAALAAMA